jgi:four helix bundle protein
MKAESTAIVFDFQRMEVYKKSILFYVGCKDILKLTTIERNVRSQLSRAAYSIVLNIAEGSGRKSPADRKHFFTISRASVFECAAVLDILRIENLIDAQTHKNQLEQANEISKMLYAMIRNLTTAV